MYSLYPVVWFQRQNFAGKPYPSLPEVCQGPFLKIASDDDESSTDGSLIINQAFLEALFLLMPAVVGNNIWKGSHRCPRNPRYASGELPRGSLTEMVTPSDEAFVIWCFENFYESVKHEVTTETEQNQANEQNQATHEAQIERKNHGKFTKQGTRKFSGWSQEGKGRWNAVVRDSTSWRNGPQPAGADCPKQEFKRLFQEQWFSTVYKKGKAKGGGGVEKGDMALNCVITSFEEIQC